MPAGIREDSEVRVWDAVLGTDTIDWVRGAIRIEFQSIAGSASEIAK